MICPSFSYRASLYRHSGLFTPSKKNHFAITHFIVRYSYRHVHRSESNPKMQRHLRGNGLHFVNASTIVRPIVSNKQTAMSYNDEYFSPISYQTSHVFAAREEQGWY